MNNKINPYIFGLLGLLGMGIFYYGLLALTTGDTLHPFIFFKDKWYLLGPLFIGFAIQMFLFQKLRIVVEKNSLAMAGASAGTSGVAMIACCAHHLAEIFPLLGFAGLATILTDYQDWFLLLSVLINIAGIIYMVLKLKKHTNMVCCQT